MKKKIYEGKAKVIYKGKDPNTLIQYFKDDATAFNNKKKGVIPGKGVINNLISEPLYRIEFFLDIIPISVTLFLFAYVMIFFNSAEFPE